MANKNIRKGPTIQVIKSEENNKGLLFNVAGTFAKSTFVKGGYIIKINPIANGIFVVPIEKVDKIQSVR